PQTGHAPLLLRRASRAGRISLERAEGRTGSLTSIVSKGPAARLRTAAHALPLAAGILVLALAPARADVAAKPAGDASTADPTSLAGEYLAGRFAAQIKALPDSARYYGEALRLDPLNPFLIERTFVLRLAIGQIEEAL